jgi:hypothetical protein
MPEPLVAGQVPQTEVADAPREPADKPRTQTGGESLLSFLDIPADVQEQLKPREAQVELPGDVPIPPETQEPPPPSEDEQPSRDGEAADESEEESEDEQPPAAAQAEAPKLDKRQKRINRLTRQKSEIQGKLDATFAELEEARRQLTLVQGQQQQAAAGAAPIAPNRLGWIVSEQQLLQEVSKADAMIEWCDANVEGVTVGDGNYIGPEQIAYWRREAQKIVMAAPLRRDELRAFSGARNFYDGLTREAWPEIVDQSTPDYQIAMSLKAKYPILTQMPEGDYVTGLLIEGGKSLDARNAAKSKNGQRQHRDIDERAFAPRVPLSPHVANPPSRPVTPSSKQRLNEAMSNLVKDVDGSAASVAATFAALEAARPTQRPSSKTLVRS